MDITTKAYWQKQYKNNATGWNIGSVSSPIKEYIDQLTDLNIRILIPGAGHAYEAEYLFNKGFKNVFVLDFASIPLQNLHNRIPEFPNNQLMEEDFFKHIGSYDLIIEQTFFSALHPEKRTDYVKKMHELLAPKGKLVGLLFDKEFGNSFPPFGGDENMYRELFQPLFCINAMERAYNSIKPRKNNELFINLSPS